MVTCCYKNGKSCLIYIIRLKGFYLDMKILGSACKCFQTLFFRQSRTELKTFFEGEKEAYPIQFISSREILNKEQIEMKRNLFFIFHFSFSLQKKRSTSFFVQFLKHCIRWYVNSIILLLELYNLSGEIRAAKTCNKTAKLRGRAKICKEI